MRKLKLKSKIFTSAVTLTLVLMACYGYPEGLLAALTGTAAGLLAAWGIKYMYRDRL